MTEPLYADDQGRAITTHSMLKTMERCPKQTDYKYHQRLKKRMVNEKDKPLRRGTWFHKLLEVHYAGGDWRVAHRQLTDRFNDLFDEERDALGDLPREMRALMVSYLWHYGADKSDPFHGWTVHETEVTLECAWPDGRGIYRCRLDLLVEDEFGLWIVDHKTNIKLPDMRHRIMDKASALYIWCAQQNNIPVLGFVWNYVRAKAPSVPALVDQKRTPRLSRSACDTDFPTAYRAIKSYGLDIEPHRAWLRSLKNQRWQYGAVQSSTFFRRDTLEKDPALIDRVLKAAMRTRDRMHGYDFSDPDSVERVADRSCDFMCGYVGLCETELFAGTNSPQSRNIRRQQFKTGDPLDYYQDQKDTGDSLQ